MSKSKLFTFLLIFLSFSAIFSFYNFDSASAQGVIWTYNADTNTATASGSGSTNFAALVAADTAGGWGKFTADATGTQILCKAKIIAGDGTNALTWIDTEKQVLFDAVCTGGNQRDFYVQSNAVVTFGILINATAKTTSSGCAFRSTDNYTGCRIIEAANSATAIFNLYSCFLETSYGGSGSWSYLIPSKNCNIYNTQLAKNVFLAYGRGNYYNVIVAGADKGVYQLPATMDKMVLIGNRMALYPQPGTATYTVKNTKITDETYTVVFSASNTTVNLVNCESDTWHFYFAASASARCNRQYEFDLNVLNGEITDFVQNANVTLFKDGSKIYSALTNSSGMIPTQILTYGYYQQATGDTIQNATSPYYLVISHPDWQTYVSRFYITQPLRLTVSMQEPTYTGYTEAEKSDYTTIILFVISLILCIIGLALTVPLLPLISLTISVINIIFLSEPTIFNILLIVLNVTFTLIALVRAKTKNN